MAVETVAVVGAGTMGNGIAHVFALHGYKTTLIDLDPTRLDEARDTIAQNLTRQVENDAITSADRASALDRLSLTPDTPTGVHGVDLGVEAVPEDKALKAEVFGTLDEHAPDDAILASNTSSISITWIGSQTDRPERVVGMHFFNPVPVMTLVEGGAGAADERRDVRRGGRRGRRSRQTSCGGGRLPRFRLQPGPDADDQRGDLLRDGGRRRAGRH